VLRRDHARTAVLPRSWSFTVVPPQGSHLAAFQRVEPSPGRPGVDRYALEESSDGVIICGLLCLPSAGLLPLPRIGRVCCSGSFLASWPCFRGQYADPEVRLSWPGADTLFRLRALKTNCITETLRVCAPESSRLRGYYAPPLRVA
jgi:hypothetical protein